MLDVFRDALSARQWPKLLSLLLDDWRKHRDPRVADLIDLVSTCADEFLECPGGTNPKRRLEQWTKFTDPADPRTLRPALRAIEGWKQPVLGEALRKLDKWPDDCRFTAWRCELVAPDTIDSHLEPFSSNCDVRALPTLRRLRGELESYLLDSVIESLTNMRVVETWSAADLDLMKNEVTASLEARRTTRAALLAAVYAKPNEDGPRAVLADFLQELGDPRGEFIALQLAHGKPSDDRKRSKRESELLELWSERWAQPLAEAVVKGTIFRRGFPSVCTMRDADPTLDVPEWATVERIVTTALGARAPGSFFWARRFPALRELGPVDPSIVSVAEPHHIERLTLDWCGDVEFSRLINSPAFGRLCALHIETQARFDPMVLDRIGANSPLRELSCTIAATSVGRWARVLAGHRGPLTSVRITGIGNSFWWTLAPTSAGLRITESGWVNDALEAEQHALPIFAT